ncbi:MAG: monooxygenase [Catenulispora sp.]|nr:monooxygenase [Catenulispora sp.]
MLLRIEGRDLPGMAGVRVAVQVKDKPKELLDPQRGDAEAVAWELPVEPFTTKDGVRTLRGRHVQTGIGGRFVYLSWGEAGDDGAGFVMFRRSKLMLEAIPDGVLEAAVESGVLHARVHLTDAKGQPISARLVPPKVEWSAG